MSNEIQKLVNDTKEQNETYALVAVDGEDVVFVFEGNYKLLAELIPKLEEKVKEKLIH